MSAETQKDKNDDMITTAIKQIWQQCQLLYPASQPLFFMATPRPSWKRMGQCHIRVNGWECPWLIGSYMVIAMNRWYHWHLNAYLFWKQMQCNPAASLISLHQQLYNISPHRQPQRAGPISDNNAGNTLSSNITLSTVRSGFNFKSN